MSVFTLHKVLQRYNSHPKWSNIIKKQYRWSIISFCLWSRDPFTHMKPVVLRGCVVVLVVCVCAFSVAYLFIFYILCLCVLQCCCCCCCCMVLYCIVVTAVCVRIIFTFWGRVMIFVDLFVSVVHYCWLWSIDEYIFFIVWTSFHL